MNDTNITTIASSVEEFLSCHAISYDILSQVPTQSLEQAASRLKISPYEFARAVVLNDGDETCMAVLPLNYILDFSALYKITGRNYKPAPVKMIRRIFKDCESRAIPPLGMAYGLKTIVDNSLYKADKVIFEAGRHNSLVRINRKGFLKLTEQARHTNFAKPESSLKHDDTNGESGISTCEDGGKSIQAFAPYEKMNALLKDLYEMPALPDNARKLLELRSHSNASEDDLSDVFWGDICGFHPQSHILDQRRLWAVFCLFSPVDHHCRRFCCVHFRQALRQTPDDTFCQPKKDMGGECDRDPFCVSGGIGRSFFPFERDLSLESHSLCFPHSRRCADQRPSRISFQESFGSERFLECAAGTWRFSG